MKNQKEPIEIGEPFNGFRLIKCDGKYNFLDEKANLLLKEYVPAAYVFQDGCARIMREDGKWNFVNTRGRLISPERWFDYAWDFENNCAKVGIGKANLYIDRYGRLFDSKGSALYAVKHAHKIPQKEEDFDYIGQEYDGVRSVRVNDKWNFIDNQGLLVSEEWFVDVSYFREDFAQVQREDGKWNFIDKKGKFLSKEWFLKVYFFDKGFAIVVRDDEKQNIINKGGTVLSSRWFDYIGVCNDGYFYAEDFFVGNGSYGEVFAINTKGELCDYKTKEVIKEENKKEEKMEENQLANNSSRENERRKELLEALRVELGHDNEIHRVSLENFPDVVSVVNIENTAYYLTSNSVSKCNLLPIETIEKLLNEVRKQNEFHKMLQEKTKLKDSWNALYLLVSNVKGGMETVGNTKHSDLTKKNLEDIFEFLCKSLCEINSGDYISDRFCSHRLLVNEMFRKMQAEDEAIKSGILIKKNDNQ